MKNIIGFLLILCAMSCPQDEVNEAVPISNPKVSINIPKGFPAFNPAIKANPPTEYGVKMGERLFNDVRFSRDNSISCAACHNQDKAFSDGLAQAKGVEGRIGLRNTPPIQNMAFMKFYMWDGNMLDLEHQSLIPIITKEEMNSSILDVIGKIKNDPIYKDYCRKIYGDDNITADRIYKTLAQYQYTLVSADSKYDKVSRGEGVHFTEQEQKGYQTFQQKCATCHSGGLFTDQSFRNVGFPINPNTDEAGRGRVTGRSEDFMSFRVPSLRNIEYTAPYGSFGQFPTLKAVLDYFDHGVVASENLDPELKNNGNRIPLSEEEKLNLISFMKTLSDPSFVGK